MTIIFKLEREDGKYDRAMRHRIHGDLAMMAEDDQWSRRPPGRMRHSAPTGASSPFDEPVPLSA